jgi:hypothetical protein
MLLKAADTLVLILFAAAAAIVDTGGGVLHAGGVRLSAQSGWRPLIWALGLLLLRIVALGWKGPWGLTWRQLAATLGWRAEVREFDRSPLPGWREVLIVLLGLTAVVVVVFHEQYSDLYAVPDFGDPLFSMWRMAWVSHQVLIDPRHLFDANIFYPAKATLTYSDSMILPALTAAPLLWFGVHPALAYTILFQSGFILSGVATYLLARATGFGQAAAWIAALVFCVYPYRIDHYSHLELQMAQWMPLAALAAHRTLSSGHPRYVAYQMLAVAAQWYSSMYYGLFLMFYLAVFIGILAIAWRPGWRRVAYAMVGLVLGAALAIPLARAYARSEPERGTRPVDVIQHYSARPIDYLQPTHRNAWYGSVAVTRRVPERELFPGVMPLVLAAAGTVPPLSATRLAFLGAGLVAFDGSLGFHGHWYPLAHGLLSPLKSLRVPARFAILVGLTLAILSASAVERGLRRISSAGARRLAVAALSAGIVIEQLPALHLRPVWRQPPSIYGTLGPASGALLFEYPIRPDPNWLEANIPYMYFSIWHWTPMVNGYSGFRPQSYAMLAESTSGFPGGSSVEYLQHLRVTHVTVHCALWDVDSCTRVLEQLDRDPRFSLITGSQWEGAPSRLYRLR